MKLKIKNIELLTALKLISSLTQVSYTSIRSNYIIIRAKKNILTIIWSSENISGIFNVKNGITILEEGEAVVKTKIILNLISKIKDSEIEISLIDNLLRIETKTYTSNINTSNKEILPEISINTDKWEKIEIDNNIFNLGIKKVQNSSIIHSEKINKFSGIHIESKPNKNELRFIATDSYKLSTKKFKSNNLVEINALIKTSTLIQVINYIKLNEKIQLFKSNNELIIQTKDFTLKCPTISSNFPNIDNLIEVQGNIKFKASIKDLLNALEKIVALTNNDKNHTAKMLLNEKNIKLECKNPDLGNSCEIIEVTTNTKDEFKTSFNALYLIDLLKNFDNDLITFVFNNENSPFYIVDEKEKDFVQVLMPLVNL